MKFFYGFMVLALFAAAQALPAETVEDNAALIESVPEPVAVAEEKPAETAVAPVKENPEEKQALKTINNVLETIIDSGLLGDVMDFKDVDNVSLLIDSLKEMDPMIKFLEGLRKKHPMFEHAITKYSVFRSALESQVRIFLAPFNLIIGAALKVMKFIG